MVGTGRDGDQVFWKHGPAALKHNRGSVRANGMQVRGEHLVVATCHIDHLNIDLEPFLVHLCTFFNALDYPRDTDDNRFGVQHTTTTIWSTGAV